MISDTTLRASIATAAILVSYAIYAFTNPTGDGVVFGTVMTALGAIGGYVVGKSSSG